MDLESRINEHYDRLTANDREVLSLILRNKKQALGFNCVELAAFCHVSRTTLNRLFKKLGIAAFAEFGILLAQGSMAQETSRLDMKEIAANYHHMVDTLKGYDYREVCGLIYEAGTIYLYGTGNEQKAIGAEFKRIFLMFGKCCIDLFDQGEVEYASANFREKDLFVAVSLSGESENGIEVLRFVQHRNIETLSITRWNNNTMARMCRHNLYAGTKMIEGGNGGGYEMVAAFYILLDILSVNYLDYLEHVRADNGAGGTV